MTPDPKILQLQQDLWTLRFDPGVRDGILGPRTRGAAHDAAEKYGWNPPSGQVIPPDLIALIHSQVERMALAPVPYPDNYINLSDVAYGNDYREGKRAWRSIDAITLHQTGAPMIDTKDVTYVPHKELPPAYSRWARHLVEDPDTHEKRLTSLRAHYGIPYGGDILEIHPIDVWGWSAQGFSKRSVSIEIAGFFCGIEGDVKTRPFAPASFKIQSATLAQIEACKNLIRYIVAVVKLHGGEIKYLFGHRQSTDSRTPDPGSKVWQLIALPMLAELGLSDGGLGFTVGHGEKLPDVWTGRHDGFPY